MTKSEREELIKAMKDYISPISLHDDIRDTDFIVLEADRVFDYIRHFQFKGDEDSKMAPNWEAECTRLSEQCDCLRKVIEELQHVIDTKYGDYDRLRLIVSHIETLTGRKFK